jgi:surface antigen
MSVFGTGSKACLFGSALLFALPVVTQASEAHKAHVLQKTGHSHAAAHAEAQKVVYHTLNHLSSAANGSAVQHASYRIVGMSRGHLARHAMFSRGGHWGISCVPYARQVSGITVAGNAWQWWENAAGQYARGDRPEAGSVLNFRANHRMPMGHVAVVSRVINAREVIVDQANWPTASMRGGVSHDVAIVDVSEANNWSAVRVELDHGGDFGSVYPTYGFIYNRPDNRGIVTASVTRPVPQPRINPAPADLRPAAERPWQTYEEVAESPMPHGKGIDLRVQRASSRVNY